ncbi:MAG: DUF1566 domain-containing protein, partial [Desulfuromonadaceae bacterium]|nr:DUF1566 domain-containing protein [Desulfuromonadaceae bacterium]
WSSTTAVAAPSSAFSLNMSGGGVTNTLSKTTASYALPVRGGIDAFTVLPTSNSFGSVTINSQSEAKEFQIINGGANSIIVSSISITGSNPTQFTVATGGSAPCATLTPTLAANSSCSVTVVFSPTVSGPQSAILNIASNSAIRPTFDIPITGISRATTSFAGSDGGQAKCYDTAGLEIACAGTGQAGELRSGVSWPDPRFTANSDLTISDNLTGLVWGNDGNFPGADSCSPGVTKSWLDALAYVSCLNQTDYLGHNDWRLPSILELRSLINYGELTQSTWLTTAGFTAIKEFDYWSSTTAVAAPSSAFSLNMSGGGVTNTLSKTTASYALPVRGGIYSVFIQPNVYNFGTAIIGLSSPKMEFSITNGGESSISVNGITFTGTDASQFYVIPGGLSPCPNLTPTLNAGESCTLTVFFAPTTPTSKSAVMEVYSDDAAMPLISSVLSGNGTLQTFAITPAVTGPGGTVSCSSPVNIDTSSICTLTPSPGYVLNSITDNGTDVKSFMDGNIYTISNVINNHDVTVTFADLIAPTIETFTIPTSTTTLTIAITAFTSTDNVAVSGYCLSETDNSADCVWKTSKPTIYTFTSSAIKKLYAFVKDAAGNISNSVSANVIINSPDFISPSITEFSMPTTSDSLTVAITTFTATDNTAVTAYCLTEINSSTGCTWKSAIPASYTFSAAGNKTLFAFAKDSVGNISASKSAIATIVLPDANAPTIAAFSIPATATALSVSITTLTATDNTAVTAYCLTETDSATNCTWDSTKPTSYTFTTAGNKTLYAFVKDAAANVSNSITSTTEITLPIVDTTPPVAVITLPVNNITIPSLLEISGSASDIGSSVEKVEIQIVRGTVYYLQSDERWMTSSYWFTANGTTSWKLSLPNTLYTEGAVYTVHARAYDTIGNISSEATSTFTYSTSSATLAYTTVSINLSANNILQQGNLTIGGKLTRLPDNGSSMKSKAITLTISKPDGTQVNPSYSTTTTTDLGDFTFNDISVFDQKGSYTIQANFAGSASLSESSSTIQTLLVGSQAGYAVIVQGKIPSGEGLTDHNKATNRIYSALKARGFDDSNILYYNYTTNQSGVDALPDKTTIMNAVTGMANRMNGSPAPFYLIMVDHGLEDTFYLGSETITPADINSWLTTLEGNLNSTAKAEPRMVILGFCYSGSFIPTLSAPGRIIITSAAADEESIRGSLESDNIRSGELFLDDLFKQLSRGESLSDAFAYSSNNILMKTRKGNDYISRYGDKSFQHPMFDDDGDKAGTIMASNLTKTLYLGAGATITNSVNQEDITSVAPTAHLSPTATQIQLSLTTFGTAEAAWAEIRLPDTTITTGSSSGQLVIDLPRILLTRNPNDPKQWTGTATLTNLYQTNPPAALPAGTYEIYYAASAGDSVSSITRALAYKNTTTNTAPTAPELLTPTANSTTKTMTAFTWTDSSDPDNDLLTYTLTITDSQNTVVHKEEEITVPSTYIPEGILKDVSNYSWKVDAIDQYGAITSSQEQAFSTDNTNGLPGIIKGYLRSSTGVPITNATINTGTATATTYSNGAFLIMTQPGTYTISATATGYQPMRASNVTVSPGKAIDASMNLTVATASSKPGDCDNNETVTIAEVQSAINMFLGLKTAEACVDTSGDNAVSIAEVQKA